MKGTTARFSSPQGPGAPGRKPAWLKVRVPSGPGYERVKGVVDRLRLNTVCAEARCPNVGECWGGGTATVMVMGEVCTRACRFCYVHVGTPAPLDADEPERVAEAAGALDLGYLVVTSVNRDDLPDGGAGHFAATVSALRRRSPRTKVEVLVPDFQGAANDADTVAAAGPHVYAHNVEVVERLTPTVRDRRASYRQSLNVLLHVKYEWPRLLTKSSVMVGMGETDADLDATFRDLRGVGTDVLTIGQYLQPSPFHLPVVEMVPPERFANLEERARAMGFLHVSAGPLVRSSYRAAELFGSKTGADGDGEG